MMRLKNWLIYAIILIAVIVCTWFVYQPPPVESVGSTSAHSAVAADPGSRLLFGTFADGKVYHTHRIRKEAEEYGVFSEVMAFSATDLEGTNFFREHAEFIHNNKRGYGYWIWKAYLVLTMMQTEMVNGDILVFLDSGCHLNPLGKARFWEYIQMVREHKSGCLAFHINDNIEQRFTKEDTFRGVLGNRTRPGDRYHTETQAMSGVIFLRKCANTMNLARRWHQLSQKYHLVDDTPSVAPNAPDFVENRHDQSVLSLLYKDLNCARIEKDETWWLPSEEGGSFEEQGRRYPIWAIRSKDKVKYNKGWIFSPSSWFRWWS